MPEKYSTASVRRSVGCVVKIELIIISLNYGIVDLGILDIQPADQIGADCGQLSPAAASPDPPPAEET